MPTTMNNNSAQQQMIAQQVRTWSVFDERTLEVMQKVPRERFVPAASRIQDRGKAVVGK